MASIICDLDVFCDDIGGNKVGECEHFFNVYTNAFKRDWTDFTAWVNPPWFLCLS